MQNLSISFFNSDQNNLEGALKELSQNQNPNLMQISNSDQSSDTLKKGKTFHDKINNVSLYFQNLPKALMFYTSSFLTFSELNNLIATRKENSTFLRTENGTISPCILQRLRSAQVLTSQDIYCYRCATKMADFSKIINHCNSLIHLDVQSECCRGSTKEIVTSKQMIIGIIRKNPNLQKICLSNFSSLEITSIMPHFAKLQKLESLSVNTDLYGSEDIIASSCPNIKILKVDCILNPLSLSLLISKLKHLSELHMKIDQGTLSHPVVISFFEELKTREITFHRILVKRALNF